MAHFLEPSSFIKPVSYLSSQGLQNYSGESRSDTLNSFGTLFSLVNILILVLSLQEFQFNLHLLFYFIKIYALTKVSCTDELTGMLETITNNKLIL